MNMVDFATKVCLGPKKENAMEAKHTELPWEQYSDKIFSQNGNICTLSDPRASKYVDYTPLKISSPDFREAHENGQFIVRACNSHAALLALAQKVRTYIAYLNQQDKPWAIELYKDAEAALKLAEGGAK